MDRGAIRPGILTDASRNDSSPNASTSRNEEHMPGARRKSPPSSDAQPNTSRNDSSAILSRQQDHSQANDTTAAIKNRGRGVLPAKRYHLRSYSTHFASFCPCKREIYFCHRATVSVFWRIRYQWIQVATLLTWNPHSAKSSEIPTCPECIRVSFQLILMHAEPIAKN